MSDRIMWVPRVTDRHIAWWYNLVPANAYRGRSGGRASLTVCIGFVWSGFLVIDLGGAR